MHILPSSLSSWLPNNMQIRWCCSITEWLMWFTFEVLEKERFNRKHPENEREKFVCECSYVWICMYVCVCLLEFDRRHRYIFTCYLLTETRSRHLDQRTLKGLQESIYLNNINAVLYAYIGSSLFWQHFFWNFNIKGKFFNFV